MGWLIGGGIAALLILLGKRQTPAQPASTPDVMAIGANPQKFARSGTSGPGRGITLGAAGVKGCCGMAPIESVGGTLSPGIPPRTPSGIAPHLIAPPVSLRPTTPPAVPGVAPVTTGRYVNRLGIISVPVVGKPGYYV